MQWWGITLCSQDILKEVVVSAISVIAWFWLVCSQVQTFKLQNWLGDSNSDINQLRQYDPPFKCKPISYSVFCSILVWSRALPSQEFLYHRHIEERPLFGILHISIFTSSRYRFMRLSKVHDRIGTSKSGQSTHCSKGKQKRGSGIEQKIRYHFANDWHHDA